MSKNKKSTISLPVAIILAAVILGASLYTIQVNKQNSIENQQVIELEYNNAVRAEKEELLDECLSDVEFNYYADWYDDCRRVGTKPDRCSEKEYASYIIGGNHGYDNFIKENWCDCVLPNTNQDFLTTRLKDERSDCMDRYSN